MKGRFFKSILIRTLTAAILSSATASVSAQPQRSPGSGTTEKARIERLAGLAKVWGTVNYFHPYLAYRDIDWDKALVETIPKVNAARTPQEYNAAINHLLSFLNDKNTSAEIKVQTKIIQATNAISTKEPIRTENGVLIVDVSQIARASAKDGKAYNGFLVKASESYPRAKAIVLDLRGFEYGSDRNAEDFEWYFDDFVRENAFPELLDADLTLGSIRYRMHNGYTSQIGLSSGEYYSGFVTSAPVSLTGRNKSKTPPLAIIINDKKPFAHDIVSGLQAANRALVIQDGELIDEPGIAMHTIKLPEVVDVKIRTVELVNPDGSVGFQPDLVVPKSNDKDVAMTEALKAVTQKDFKRPTNKTSAAVPLRSIKDKRYAEMEFPSMEYRLLGLFRFWNVINYFFPYKDLIEEPWDNILPRYIPRFEANKDAFDYQMTVRELAVEIHDSHGRVQGAKIAEEKIGTYDPPVVVRFIEDQTTVTNVLDDKLPIKVGDVVLAIDGEPIEKRREFLSRIVTASTPQSFMYKIHDFFLGRNGVLSGQKDSLAKLTVRGVDGQKREVEVSRSIDRGDPRFATARIPATPVVEVLPSGFGYVDLARLRAHEVDSMFDTIKTTPAVIFDLRGFPLFTITKIAPRLTEKKTITVASYWRPLLEAKGLSNDWLDRPGHTFYQKMDAGSSDLYKGKVVVLINENAISHAEWTALVFEAARPDITFIGNPTTGANGDVTVTVLPGNLTVSFSGHNVRHADGRQLQRVGIQPHIKVAPTVRGITEGRDEILEAAVKFLKTAKE